MNNAFKHIRYFLLALMVALSFFSSGQGEIAFVSDTQAPMWVEKVALKSNQNIKATSLVFHDILQQKPHSLYILGDVVSLGYKSKKWSNMDRYLDSCRKAGILVSALLGNHDVMTRSKKGEQQFQKRFPDHQRTGYYQVVDSVAVIFLNSNFKKLSTADIQQQQSWFAATLNNLDNDPAVLVTIVACHHAPYTNSKIVGSSTLVQKYFVPDYLKSRKARLFITGHSHNFERFHQGEKDFLVIGGGGGLQQPLSTSTTRLNDLSLSYKPAFHYLISQRKGKSLKLQSRFLKDDFSGFSDGLSFSLQIP